MSDVAPNDPAVVTGLVDQLSGLISELGDYLNAWHERVDAVVVRLQNAGASEEVPGVGHTGQVPPGVVPPQNDVETLGTADDEFSPESTDSSTVPADDIGSTPPEDETPVTDYP